MNLNFQGQGIAAGLHSQQQASTILLMQCPLNMDVGIQKQFKDALHAVFTAYIMALHMKMIKDGVPPDEQPIVWHYTWTWSRMGWWADYIHEHDQGWGTTWWADYIMALHMNMIKDGVPPDEQTILWHCTWTWSRMGYHLMSRLLICEYVFWSPSSQCFWHMPSCASVRTRCLWEKAGILQCFNADFQHEAVRLAFAGLDLEDRRLWCTMMVPPSHSIATASYRMPIDTCVDGLDMEDPPKLWCSTWWSLLLNPMIPINYQMIPIDSCVNGLDLEDLCSPPQSIAIASHQMPM